MAIPLLLGRIRDARGVEVKPQYAQNQAFFLVSKNFGGMVIFEGSSRITN